MHIAIDKSICQNIKNTTNSKNQDGFVRAVHVFKPYPYEKYYWHLINGYIIQNII